MTLDPFGDFATRGYLRNLAKAKDPDIARRLQHNSIVTGLDEALSRNDLPMAMPCCRSER